MDPFSQHISCCRIIQRIGYGGIFPGKQIASWSYHLMIPRPIRAILFLGIGTCCPVTSGVTYCSIKTILSVQIHTVYSHRNSVAGELLCTGGKVIIGHCTVCYMIWIFFTCIIFISSIHHIISVYQFLSNAEVVPSPHCFFRRETALCHVCHSIRLSTPDKFWIFTPYRFSGEHFWIGTIIVDILKIGVSDCHGSRQYSGRHAGIDGRSMQFVFVHLNDTFTCCSCYCPACFIVVLIHIVGSVHCPLPVAESCAWGLSAII